MIIVAERINATRKQIKAALEKKDADFFLREAESQLDAGGDFLDLNAGLGTGREAEDLAWLIDRIQTAFPEAKLTLDSSDSEVFRKCLPMVKNRPVMVNSINAETKKIESLLPVLKEHPDSYVVALTIDDSGIPKEAEKRIEIAGTLVGHLTKVGIKEENIFFDGLVQTVGTDSEAFRNFLKTLKGIKYKYPKVKTVCGLSNVSFGLPRRKLINQYALVIALYEGLDAVIIDPLDPEIAEVVCVVDVLTGKDQFCVNYITQFRAGRI